MPILGDRELETAPLTMQILYCFVLTLPSINLLQYIHNHIKKDWGDGVPLQDPSLVLGRVNEVGEPSTIIEKDVVKIQFLTMLDNKVEKCISSKMASQYRFPYNSGKGFLRINAQTKHLLGVLFILK